MVGNAEIADLAAAFQGVEGLGHLLRLHEGIRAVEQEHVQVIRVQPLQNAVHGGEDMRPGEIVHAGTDAAFGLEEHVLPPQAGTLHGGGKHLFASPRAVDIRVVKEIQTFCHAVQKMPIQLLLRKTRDAHTAHGNCGNGKPAGSKWNCFHSSSILWQPLKTTFGVLGEIILLQHKFL